MNSKSDPSNVNSMTMPLTVPLRRLLAVFILLVMQALPSFADEAWIVGSYQDRQAAISEGERLSIASGVEVLLKTQEESIQPRYQLLLRPLEDENDKLRLAQQLRQLGVARLTPVEISMEADNIDSILTAMSLLNDVEAELDRQNAGLNQATGSFLVAASYRRLADATRYQATLQDNFESVIVKAALVNGTQYHRVMIGPLEEPVSDIEAKANALGLAGLWRLDNVTFDMPTTGMEADAESSVEPQIKPEAVEATPGDRDSTPARQTDYNPARLRPTPANKD